MPHLLGEARRTTSSVFESHEAFALWLLKDGTTKMNALQQQLALCEKYGVPHVPTGSEDKVGVALNTRLGIYPVNGVRYPPTEGTSGWYIWAGEELLTDPDFFQPLHAKHLCDWCKNVLAYLGLPPGWRFLIAPGYEDVWFDASVLGDE